jgi:hypothetical protein
MGLQAQLRVEEILITMARPRSVRGSLLPGTLLLWVSGCFGMGGGAYYAAGSQAEATPGASQVNLGAAVVSAFVSRAQGGCYAGCPAGTLCNPETGLCEELPCRGLCGWNELCQGSGLSARCVSASYALTVESLTEGLRSAAPVREPPRRLNLMPGRPPPGEPLSPSPRMTIQDSSRETPATPPDGPLFTPQ